MAEIDVPMNERRLVVLPPADTAIDVQRGVEIAGSHDTPIVFDVYRPQNSTSAPVVVIVVGYPGTASAVRPAARFKDMAFVRDWATLLAASGIAAVAYTNRVPTDDLEALLRHVTQAGALYGLDPSSLGIFAQSGNVPVALWALLAGRPVRPKCAAFMYGFMFDANGSTSVADAAVSFGFANPCSGRSVDDMDRSVPMLVVRAGRDQFSGLNTSIDRFIEGALTRNLPVSLVNVSESAHAFDLVDTSPAARTAVRQVVAFLRAHLLVGTQ